VLLTKFGTAVAFVMILQLSRSARTDQWFLYGVIWFVMFAASEIGDGISGRSSWREAILGLSLRGP